MTKIQPILYLKKHHERTGSNGCIKSMSPEQTSWLIHVPSFGYSTPNAHTCSHTYTYKYIHCILPRDGNIFAGHCTVRHKQKHTHTWTSSQRMGDLDNTLTIVLQDGPAITHRHTNIRTEAYTSCTCPANRCVVLTRYVPLKDRTLLWYVHVHCTLTHKHTNRNTHLCTLCWRMLSTTHWCSLSLNIRITNLSLNRTIPFCLHGHTHRVQLLLVSFSAWTTLPQKPSPSASAETGKKKTKKTSKPNCSRLIRTIGKMIYCGGWTVSW